MNKYISIRFRTTRRLRTIALYGAGIVKYLLLGALQASAVIPLRIRYIFSDTFAAAASLLMPAKRKNVRHNLSIILNRPAENRDVRRVFKEYGRYWCQLIDIEHIWARGKVVYDGDLPPHEKRFIGLTFHLGNFELFGPAVHKAIGTDFNVIAENLKPPFIGKFFVKIRSAYHMQTIPHDNIREIIRTIKGGKPLGLLCDRALNGGGVPVRIFGTTIRFSLQIIKYAYRYDIPVYVSYCIVDRENIRFFWKKISTAVPFEEAVKMIAQLFEDAVRKYPYQWHVLTKI